MRRLTAQVFKVSAVAAAAATLIGFGGAGRALAAKFKLLYSFCAVQNCVDGSAPTAPLLMDSAGNLYGSTSQGGARQAGAFFQLKKRSGTSYKYKVIWSLDANRDGSGPSGLIIDTEGALYGELSHGGIFKLSYGFGKNHNKWDLVNLHPSCIQGICGTAPTGGLAYQGAFTGVPYDGVSPLYGTTTNGGDNAAGTVFELDPNGGQWTEKVLYSFCSQGGDKCTDGKQPGNGVVLDQSGNLYGTTETGGGHDDGNMAGGSGVLFQLSPGGGGSWTETVLHSFCSVGGCADGALPIGSLAIDASGTLFGATLVGGNCAPDPAGCGTLFNLIPNGFNSEETVLYTFCGKRDCRDGRYPHSGPFLDAAGSLFGTTAFGGGNDIDQLGQGGGVLYELTASSLQILYAFCALADCADGELPEGGVIVDRAGRLYGASGRGGEFGDGAIYTAKP